MITTIFIYQHVYAYLVKYFYWKVCLILFFSMWVNNRLHFGTDRLFFVEHELGNVNAKPHQLLKAASQPNLKKKLKFYFDFSSPWTYLGYKQVIIITSIKLKHAIMSDL